MLPIVYDPIPDYKQNMENLNMNAGYEKMINDLESNQDIDPLERRQFARQLFSRATPCPLDRQGRLVLPYEACSSLGFSNEVLLAGGGMRIEAWNPKNWFDNQLKEENTFADTADRIGL